MPLSLSVVLALQLGTKEDVAIGGGEMFAKL